MNNSQITWATVSYFSAFLIGVILFATIWKYLFGAASGAVVLAGMAGAATPVIILWLKHRIHTQDEEQ